MRLRLLVLACGFTSFVLSQCVSALGLGEVTVRSALNQPLEAEIKLLDTRDLTAEQIIVSLASPADFERNGVDRLYFYTEFEFAVRLDSPGGPKILVTSRNPVREPYLNFLVEARWTSGRLLREYTLLMDLPTFADDTKSAPVQTPTRAPQQQVTQPRTSQPKPSSRPESSDSMPSATKTDSASQSTTESIPTKTRSQVSSISGSEYTVQPRDTLWDIAHGISRDSSASIHQAMMALYEANPDAFINGNINMLRRGQVLRIPATDEMTSRSQGDAVRQFAAQSGDTTLGAQLNASRRTSTTRSGSSEVAGRVKLAAPGSDNQGGGQGSGSNLGNSSGLESELSATLEELDKSKAENTELTSRVRDLEEQIQTMERLVEVSNEKLRAIQLSAQQATSAVAVSSVDSYAPASEDAGTLASESYAVSSVPELSPEDLADLPGAKRVPRDEMIIASSSAASQVSSAAVSSKPKIMPPPPPPPSMMDNLMDNAKWIGLAVLLIGGAIGFIIQRRRKEHESETESFDEDIFSMDTSSDEEEVPVEDDDVMADLQEDDINLDTFEEEVPVEAETGDVVAEAEIYIAYGQLDKAEELLLNGLKKDSHSADIRLKLLEVYSHLQDSSNFDKHYAALAGIAGAAALARAAELRAAIPGMGEVAPPDVKVAPEQADTSDSGLGDFSFDDLQLDDGPSAESASADTSFELADEGLNFDLDMDDEFSGLESADTTSEMSAESDWELPDAGDDSLDDFNVDLGEPEPSAEPESLEADDLSELSLALDDMDSDMIADDLEIGESSIEEEFNFDFTPPPAPKPKPKASGSDDLDVVEDDFNLDMDVSDVDLAALDHEMEALDEMGDLDDSLDIPSSGLNLTTDLDTGGGNFEADEDEDFVLKDDDVGTPTTSAPKTAAPADEDDDVFAEAMSDFNKGSAGLDLSKFDADNFEVSDEDMDAELDFLADADEAATKLDLARAYIDMGDTEGAKDILAEVVSEGNDEQRSEAKQLLSRIDS